MPNDLLDSSDREWLESWRKLIESEEGGRCGAIRRRLLSIVDKLAPKPKPTYTVGNSRWIMKNGKEYLQLNHHEASEPANGEIDKLAIAMCELLNNQEK